MSFRASGRWVALLVCLTACDAKDAPSQAEPDEKTEAPSEPAKQSEPEKASAPAPAIPEIAGAVIAGKLYIQDCGDTHPCPDLVQAEGAAHCESLDIQGKGWRLPTKEELEGMQSLSGLQMNTGYHWSATPFDQDDKQVWIVDPTGESQATTIPKDRKPFRVRCVREVPA
jgi:hypothetical protein